MRRLSVAELERTSARTNNTRAVNCAVATRERCTEGRVTFYRPDTSFPLVPEWAS